MKPELKKISQISPDQSVVCILGKNEIPAYLQLSKSEKEYALRQLRDKEELVFINSYFRCTYLVKVKAGVSGFREKEELRKAAAGMKKLVRSNNHSELVITSHSMYSGAIGDFAEGLLLSFYSFDKYKTRDED
jgi:leucyl aminopeptidase